VCAAERQPASRPVLSSCREDILNGHGIGKRDAFIGTNHWTTHDWIFNLAGLLAYNFLMALFPLLLLLVAVLGIILNRISPQTELTVQQYIAGALPANVGTSIVEGVITHLKHSVGTLLLVGIVTSHITGSRLFLTLENCFGIIFRLGGRPPLRYF
jgi:uncharacterized BrkB/YihY/UPF0761 family membrane protein